eukprot:TRINITY_DN10370_c0_g1_i1.p1 TRINITY_DN10370_c0_g1~~TRINITY_DN10370_c0_g1_i1.p1  ORF type:complete len:265 (+),score=68.76 TRINITY_DN10370_c0_g1_i1:71-865(+)
MSQFRCVDLAQGAAASGCRLTWREGRPAIFALALKLILEVKKVPVLFVRHPVGPESGGPAGGQDELYRLTAQRSLPVLFWNDERPRSIWNDQLYLAERIGGGPRLIPQSAAERAQMFGLIEALLGEEGLVANKRHLFGDNPLTRKYGFTSEKHAAAPRRFCEVLALFDKQLAAQQSKGSRFLVGDALSAVDIYFAGISVMIDPPGADVVPRTAEGVPLLKKFTEANTQEMLAAFTPRLRAFRDHILRTYVECPFNLGGTPASRL